MTLLARAFSTLRLMGFCFSRGLASLIVLLCLLVTPALAVTYTDNGDGTVTDPTTGLTWMRCSMGQAWTGGTCTGTAGTYTWDQANALTGTMTFAGQGDWRLPNIRELTTIVDRSQYNPTIDRTAFPNTQIAFVWSATADANVSTGAWVIDFSVANIRGGYGKNGAIQVRLVRGGQSLGLLDVARPTSDYVDHGDGTATHTPTGLMWKRCAEGQDWNGSTCIGLESIYTWDAAKLLTSTFTGKNDWRMPTEEELLTLVDYTRYNPATNTTIFPITSGPYFWSTTANVGSSGYTWLVFFGDGSANSGYTGSAKQVRLVRASSSMVTTLNLVSGWNLLGNSSTGALDVLTIFGDTTKVNTVWKWIASGAKWAFYTPSLLGQALTDYATSKGYDTLTTVNGGEGFWVNAKSDFIVPLPTGAAVTSATFQTMASGWNLIAIGDNKTPSQFNALVSATTPLTTLWAWDVAKANWYFYAPALDTAGTLSSYIASKGYLDFGGKILDPTTGFWVNKP